MCLNSKNLKKATNFFDESAIFGSGAFGVVYKGIFQTSVGQGIFS